MSKSNSVSLKERMLSACTGSLLTSLILTPMDVVRIRLQQQEMLPTCSCDVPISNTANSISKSGMSSNKLFWQDSCFQDISCKNTTVRYNSTWEAFSKISKLEGITTLWRGISITLLMAVPANIVYFTGYESLRDWSSLGKYYPTLNPLLCGALARIMAATCIAPLELLKTRLQSIPRGSKESTTAMMIKDLIKESKLEIKNYGYGALFKGLEITLWRDVPFSAIYWASYEFYKKNFWLNTDSLSSLHSGSNWSYFTHSFIGGSISGTTAALFTHPFDVGKTRLQISIVNASSSAFSTEHDRQVKNTLAKKRSKNMFKYLNEIRKTEGAGALYTGLVPRIMKIAPSCAIMISTYEISKKLFSS